MPSALRTITITATPSLHATSHSTLAVVGGVLGTFLALSLLALTTAIILLVRTQRPPRQQEAMQAPSDHPINQNRSQEPSELETARPMQELGVTSASTLR